MRNSTYEVDQPTIKKYFKNEVIHNQILKNNSLFDTKTHYKNLMVSNSLIKSIPYSIEKEK